MIGRRSVLAAGFSVFAAGAAARAKEHSGEHSARSFDPRDLDGIWNLGSYTEVERPKGIEHLVMTPAEAEAYDAPRRAGRGELASEPGDDVGQNQSEWNDRGTGLARVKGQIRSSAIVDPPDGKLPYRPAAAAVAKNGALDDPETMGGTTRCMVSVAALPPMLGAPDANLVQFLRAGDDFVILAEKYHDARIVRLGTTLRAGADPPGYLGSSVGRWEGETLVVETAGFHPGVIHRGQRLLVSGATRVTERLTRVGPDEIYYAFTVEDPDLYTRPWRGETTLRRSRDRIFEYACHEGNYSLPGMMAGARREEAVAAKAPPAPGR
jgi:hypothetical protein